MKKSTAEYYPSTYYAASNAMLNTFKTEAFPLSGTPNSGWRQFLHTSDIDKWYDRSSSQPLIYLGYPMCFSTAQRNTYFDTLLTKIRISCQLHSARNLSLCGLACSIPSFSLAFGMFCVSFI